MDNGSTDHSNYDMKKIIQDEENSSGSSFWGFSEEEFLSLKKALDTSFENETKSQAKFLQSSQELKDYLDLDTVRFKPHTFILQGAKDTVNNLASEMSSSLPELPGTQVHSGSEGCSVLELHQINVTDSPICVANQEQFVEIDKKVALSTNNFCDIPRNVLYGNDVDNVHDETLTGCLTENKRTHLKNEDDMFTSRIACLSGFRKLNLYSQSDQRSISGYSENSFEDKIGKKYENLAEEEIVQSSTLAESSDEDYKSATSSLSESDAEPDIPIPSTMIPCLGNESENHMPDSDFDSRKDVAVIFSENEASFSLETLKTLNNVSKILNDGSLCKNNENGENAAAKNTMLQNNKYEIKLFPSNEEMESFYLDTAFDTNDQECCLTEDDNETYVLYKSSNANKNLEEYHKNAAFSDVILQNIKKENITEVDIPSDGQATFSQSKEVISPKIEQKSEDQDDISSNEDIISSHFDIEFKVDQCPKIYQQYEDQVNTSSDEEITSSKFETESEEIIPSKIRQTYEDQADTSSDEETTYSQFHTEFKEATSPKINQQYEDQVNTTSDEETTLSKFDTESEEIIPSKIRQTYEDQADTPSHEETTYSQFHTKFKEATSPKINQQYEDQVNTTSGEETTLSKFDTESEEIIPSKIRQTYEDQADTSSDEETTYSQFHTEFKEATSRKVNQQNKVQGSISSEEEIRSSQSDIESEEFISSKISQLCGDRVDISSEEEITSIQFDIESEEIIPVELKKQYEDQLHIPSSVKITTNQCGVKPKEITPQKIRLQYESMVKVDKSLDEDIISSHSDIESESNSENSSTEVETKSRLKILQRFRRKSVHKKRSFKILHHPRLLRKPHFRKSGDKKLLKSFCASLKISKKRFKRNKKVSETSVSDDGTCTEITSEERSPPLSETSFKEVVRPNTAQVNMEEALNALLLMPSYLEQLESLKLVPVYNMKIEKSRLFHKIIENEADESFDSNVFDDDENYVEDIVDGIVQDERRNSAEKGNIDGNAVLSPRENLQLEGNETKIQANENPKKIKKKVRFKLDEDVITEKSAAKGKGCFSFMHLFPSHESTKITKKKKIEIKLKMAA